MFIAMNRFKVNPARSQDFETVWLERESNLAKMPGFVRFALLRGDVPGEYISHSTWRDRKAFEGWTQSESFKASHSQRMDEGILEGHPMVSFYESVTTEEAAVHA
jgi:heme-degrading monooxygenase HmoA